MGISVSSTNVVTFDGSREVLVNTSIASNPSSSREGGLLVYSIFKRLLSRERAGDGNPLIYALKAKNGFTITPRECTKFTPNMSVILDKILKSKNIDYIITMPSSHGIAEIVAKRIQRKLPNKPEVITDFFEKKTVQEVYQELSTLEVPPKLKSKLVQLRMKLETSSLEIFSMKLVDPHLRNYISPLKIKGNFVIENQKSILMVDDLLATGATLKCANNLLSSIEDVSYKIEAICLFSKV